MLNNVELKKFFYFSCIGAINTIIGFIVIFILIFLGFNPYFSNFFGYLVGFFIGFFLNKKITFNSSQKNITGLLKYTLVFAIAYISNLMFLYIFLTYISSYSSWLGQFLGFPIYFIINYLGCRYYVYNTGNECTK
jgi:putative flippase GtrA